MNIRNLFRPKPAPMPEPVYHTWAEYKRAKKHAKCDEMRAAMGMTPVDWSAL